MQRSSGTLVTAANGVQIVTDQDITVSAANYPTLGQASVSAHSTQAGPAGNLKAGVIYGPCCRVNISAVNGALSGGQDTRNYQTVTQHDIDSASASLKASLDQSTTAALQTQVQSTETLATPLHCQQKTSADHQPGDEAASVHVTLDETCTGIVYQTQALQTLITQALTENFRLESPRDSIRGMKSRSLFWGWGERDRTLLLKSLFSGRVSTWNTNMTITMFI